MQRVYSLLPLCFLAVLLMLSSCKSGNVTKAKEAYDTEQYFSAAELYKNAYSSTKDKQERADIAYKVANSYRLINDFSKAEGWYRKAMNLGKNTPDVRNEYAQVLMSQEKYEEAITELEAYKKERPSDTTVDTQIEILQQAKNYKENPPQTRFKVEPFRFANSKKLDNDFAPAIYKDDGIYFSSDREEGTGKKTYGRTGRGFEDIFFLPLEKKGRKLTWGTPQPVAELGYIYNNSTPALDAKGNDMYFTRCNPPKEEGKGQMPNCVIMHSERRGKTWGPPEKLPFCTDTTIRYGQPTISPDGTKMIFVMDGPYGKGKHDLYLTTYVKRSRTWSDPVNLGDVINTPADEMYPYLFNDTTLYFATNGRPGLGGLDLYVSYGQGTEWSEPKHLYYPINSGGDDFGIVFDKTGLAGYFSTNRPGTRGDDIYSFTMEPLVFTLTGVVTNSENKMPLKGATVKLTNKKTGKEAEQKTDATGKYTFKLDENTGYDIYAIQKGFFPSDEYQKTTEGLEFSATLHQDLQLKPPVITLNNIYYGLDSANIRPSSAIVLDSLVEVLNTYPTITIELGSHTDCRASFKHNDSLSQARSDSAVAYVVKRGIDKERLVAKGYGERQLTNNCGCEPNNVGPGANCTEAEHQANRRTTVKILSWDYKPKPKEEKAPEKAPEEKKEGE